MREIKFRGLHLEFDYWVYGSLVNYNPTPEIQQTEIGENDYDYPSDEVKPETVGQFTGLQDKNKVDIYEGDLVISKYTSTPHVVKYGLFNDDLTPDYKLCNAIGFCVDEITGLGYDINGEMSFEVIGNIYENSNLISK